MWLLLASPYISILLSFFIIKGIIPDGNDDPEDKKALTLVASYMFAFIVLIGFSLCSGLYILSPVADREKKLRHLMNFVGIKSLAYYLGSFLADIIIFALPTFGFVLLMFPLKIEYFIIHGSWAIILILMISFGFCLIGLTYLFSFLFSNSDNAFKNIGTIYVIGGTFAPTFLGGLLAGIT